MNWPAPYLQPDPRRDCMLYATAYVARCLGHHEATAEDVRRFRAERNRVECQYPGLALDHDGRGYWEDRWNNSHIARKVWWLGPNARKWVRFWVERGWVGIAHIHRVQEMSHVVAVLGCDEQGVLLMDPIFGFKREPWDWFLGPGAGRGQTCHRVEMWYRLPAAP